MKRTQLTIRHKLEHLLEQCKTVLYQGHYAYAFDPREPGTIIRTKIDGPFSIPVWEKTKL